MQKRYCACGAEVMVDYSFKSMSARWRSRFFLAGQEGRASVKECPCCKRKLAIDALR